MENSHRSGKYNGDTALKVRSAQKTDINFILMKKKLVDLVAWRQFIWPKITKINDNKKTRRICEALFFVLFIFESNLFVGFT